VEEFLGGVVWVLGLLWGFFLGRFCFGGGGGGGGSWQASVAMSWDLEDLGTYAGVGFVSPGGLI